jgi:uncharacterized protein
MSTAEQSPSRSPKRTDVARQLRLFALPAAPRKPAAQPARLRRTSDMLTWSACAHAAETRLRIANGLIDDFGAHDEMTALLIELGNEHEATYAQLRRRVDQRRGRAFVEVHEDPSRMVDPRSRKRELKRNVDRTRLAVLDPKVGTVYQAVLSTERPDGLILVQHADFIERDDDGNVRVVDTKLSMSPKPKQVLQVSFYHDSVATITTDANGDVVLRMGDERNEYFDPNDSVAVRRRLLDRYSEWDAETTKQLIKKQVVNYPLPNDHCSVCEYTDHCDTIWKQDDHLSLVLGLDKRTRAALERAGITKVAELAQSTTEIAGVHPRTLNRIRQQALLDVAKREADATNPHTDNYFFSVLPPSGPYRGFAALPAPSDWDIYFDFEQDPQYGVDPLLYLIVRAAPDPNTGPTTRWQVDWAHSYEHERRNYVAMMEGFLQRHARRPEAHAYHYAAFEPSQLMRLAQKYNCYEKETEALISDGFFVDLYAVVRNSIQVSLDSYSQKKIEKALGISRAGEIVTAVDSLVRYQNWMRKRLRDDSELRDIEEYCKEDVGHLIEIHMAILDLRTLWIEAYEPQIRSGELDATMFEFGQFPRSNLETKDALPTSAAVQLRAEATALADKLQERIGDVAPKDYGDTERAYAALIGSLRFHDREFAVAWQRHQSRLSATAEELVADSESIGLLQLIDAAGDPVVDLAKARPYDEFARSSVWRYSFDPNQDSKLEAGKEVIDPVTGASAGKIYSIDLVEGIVMLSRSRQSKAPHPQAIIPQLGPTPRALQQALVRLATNVAANGLLPGHGFEVEKSILMRVPPKVATVQGAATLDNEILAIQGPPGTGKTRLCAEVIGQLLSGKHGQRVAVTANSHAAIRNLLTEFVRQSNEAGVSHLVWQKGQKDEIVSGLGVGHIKHNDEVVTMVAKNGVKVTIGGGTAWLWSDEKLYKTFDTIIVDEASQFALPDLLAVAQCARNVIVAGDPQQLKNVTAGRHVGDADQSIMRWLIGDKYRVIPPHRGVFLPTTYRMHPEIASFCSETMYNSQLTNDPSTANFSISPTSAAQPLVTGTGLRLITSGHKGNRSSSVQEIEIVGQVLDSLVGQQWTDQLGESRLLRDDDILVVTPFNSQRIHLEHVLRAKHPDIRVGTVDKLQGQQAPVVVYTTATSDPSEASRGAPFVLDNHRLNVAVSRAQALVVMVTNEGILNYMPHTVEELVMVNGFARFAELAEPIQIVAPSVAPTPTPVSIRTSAQPAIEPVVFMRTYDKLVAGLDPSDVGLSL